MTALGSGGGASATNGVRAQRDPDPAELTPSPGETEPPDPVLTRAVLEALAAAGVAASGVAAVEPFTSTRHHLEERRRAGLHGGMAFTYRNPARSTDPARIIPGGRSLVVAAWPYLRHEAPVSETMLAPGRVARYARADFYAELEQALEGGASVLRHAGHRAVTVADSNALVDREAARRAGIGWYGKNTNLLLPGAGSWFVLGTIVTTAALVLSERVSPGCGSCTKCVAGCPTGAIVEHGVIDARRCLAWLVQAPGVIPWDHRIALGDRIYGCDDCQEVCPPNVAAQRHLDQAVGGTPRAVVDAVAFIEGPDDEVLEAAGRWYVQQRDPRYLRRNALVVLANAADPYDPAVLAVVERALRHQDPLVRAHAVWAAARLGRPELADEPGATEADPMVLEELRRRPQVEARGAP